MTSKDLSVLVNDLAKDFPLPKGWVLAVNCQEFLPVHDKVGVTVLGLTAHHEQIPDQMVTASSGSLQKDFDSIAVRAYFELIERVTIIDTLSTPQRMLSVYSLNGIPKQQQPVSKLFPSSVDPQRWLYAKSNGVAAHRRREDACWFAYKELIERALVLNSWYGGRPPRKILDTASFLPKEVASSPTLPVSLFEFNEAHHRVYCAGAFIKSPQGFYVYGFSSGKLFAPTVQSALDEAFQRWGFLADQELANELPTLSPRADYHQDYYLTSHGTKLLETWLQGQLTKNIIHTPTFFPELRDCLFVDLTPINLRGKCWVIKAIHQDLPPLIFGQDPFRSNDKIQDNAPHPIA